MHPKQKVEFHPFGVRPLSEILGLTTSVSSAEALKQLQYVESYVGDALRCRSLVLERHYIDRDYIEDHSVFYSKNLQGFRNWCQRLHFFSCESKQLHREMNGLRRLTDPQVYKAACNAFSEEHYLGFSVIKPLPGSPVGRTVLKPMPAATDDDSHARRFDCAACLSTPHLLGVALHVCGLAFQQQDVGVSACATTALWSALHRAGIMEQRGAATPAQITIQANQYAQPFGRLMPSEGLSLDQMCQAVHALGHSANVFRVEDFCDLRSLLHSSVGSGISPVLILKSTKDPSIAHAVAVAGMKLKKPHRRCLVFPGIDDMAGDLTSAYIHDDRYGPYLRADLKKARNGESRLLVEMRSLDNGPAPDSEEWRITHVLIPVHPKVHISFGELRALTFDVVGELQGFRQLFGAPKEPTSVQNRVLRAHTYVERMITGTQQVHGSVIEQFCSTVPFSRYFGIINLEAADCDPIDVIVDTTSTARNLNYLAVIAKGRTRLNTTRLAYALADTFECPLFVNSSPRR